MARTAKPKREWRRFRPRIALAALLAPLWGLVPLAPWLWGSPVARSVILAAVLAAGYLACPFIFWRRGWTPWQDGRDAMLGALRLAAVGVAAGCLPAALALLARIEAIDDWLFLGLSGAASYVLLILFAWFLAVLAALGLIVPALIAYAYAAVMATIFQAVATQPARDAFRTAR